MQKQTIYIIEDDPLMAECFARSCREDIYNIYTFPDAVSAMQRLDQVFPDLIILDILLKGPDGFTFLQELASYSDTAEIPVILVSSLDLSQQDLAHYGVREVLSKDTITPAILKAR